MPIKNPTPEQRERKKLGALRWLSKQKGYGITPEKFNEYCIQIDFCCEICGVRGKDGHHTKLQVDHSHDEHTFRGALCGSCNRGIGVFKDSSELLRKAAKYLEGKNVDRTGHQ